MNNYLPPVIGTVFTAATQLQLPLAQRRLIIGQPGYKRGSRMILLRTDNGIRLFTAVGTQWMDASLQAIDSGFPPDWNLDD